MKRRVVGGSNQLCGGSQKKRDMALSPIGTTPQHGLSLMCLHYLHCLFCLQLSLIPPQFVLFPPAKAFNSSQSQALWLLVLCITSYSRAWRDSYYIHLGRLASEFTMVCSFDPIVIQPSTDVDVLNIGRDRSSSRMGGSPFELQEPPLLFQRLDERISMGTSSGIRY